MSGPRTIRRLRREKGLTQQQLADKIGVSRESIRAWEAGEQGAHPGNALKLAEALGSTVTELFPLDDEPTKKAAA